MLLPDIPIAETLKLQYSVFAQPPGTFLNVDNLVVFNFGGTPDTLKEHQLFASYFPDGTRKDSIHALHERNGRIYADDQPLHMEHLDPDFHGNKWLVHDGKEWVLKK